MLMTEGREEGAFKRSQGTVKSVQRVIAAGRFQYYRHNPRLVPDQFSPVVNKVVLTIPPTPKADSKKAKSTLATAGYVQYFFTTFHF